MLRTKDVLDASTDINRPPRVAKNAPYIARKSTLVMLRRKERSCIARKSTLAMLRRKERSCIARKSTLAMLRRKERSLIL